MFNFVEKMWENMGESRWENCGKISTSLTKIKKGCEMLWEMFGFTRSFGDIYTLISTEILFGLTDLERVDLHIYT
ncbi:hypothetical protein IKF27_00150 [Candidatus Saccharibacteria bacterium]|nr:hypothetical protein [Candidatus Saccharibacteria bacterium]